MAEAVEQLKQEGYPVNESDLAHIWPTRFLNPQNFVITIGKPDTTSCTRPIADT